VRPHGWVSGRLDTPPTQSEIRVRDDEREVFAIVDLASSIYHDRHRPEDGPRRRSTNRTYLSGVERSERNVSIDNIARIAKGLRVAPSKLLEDDQRASERG
jgi:transcriptional regulator with XRE-family HTH domain